ncbi:MAG TPA: FCD domain-containing protein [Candidatus Rothia avistercoris]|uniref:FCD domain-containing protein n=1 Tax=Candidatus Rothia avistercoris TaxID=2840479 RepID=A0A9D2ZTE1_9MICC|nr:FCD domain-containing protein [Candidatus Rothia avistercoris]
MAHHQQLLDWIENELINQTLNLGESLPDDRVLAHEVGISQNHIRESLKHCEEIGVLRLYEGRKKSIIAQLVREPAASAGPAVSLYLASSRSPRQDLLSTCLLLESHALAGPAFDQTAFEELDRIVEVMQDDATSLSDFHELEADFHIQLGRLSGNALISALLATLRDAMIEARFELVSQVPLWSATSSRLRMEYRAIVDAARSGDAALAQTLLKANLQERFAEAGHPVDIDTSDQGGSGVNLEPIEVETQELVPEDWGGPIEPELFEALTTIQPIEAAPTADLPPAKSVSRRKRGTVSPVVRAASSAASPDPGAAASQEAETPTASEAPESQDAREETASDGAEAVAPQGDRNQPSKKRFDLVGYFGFRKSTPAQGNTEADKELFDADAEGDPEEEAATLREGYEYATSDR